MQFLKTPKKKINLSSHIIRLSLLFFCLSLLSLIITQPVSAVSVPSGQGVIPKELENCPEPIKNLYKNQENLNLRGTLIYAVKQDPNGGASEELLSSCGFSAQSFVNLVIKLTVALFSLFGLFFAISFLKSAGYAIAASISKTTDDNYEKAQMSATSALKLLAGGLGFYAIVVFIGIGIFGLGGGNRTYNIICQNQIVFNIVVDEVPPVCNI